MTATLPQFTCFTSAEVLAFLVQNYCVPTFKKVQILTHATLLAGTAVWEEWVFHGVGDSAILRGAKGGDWQVTANLKVETSRGMAPLCAAGDRYKSTNTDVDCILRDSVRVYTAEQREQGSSAQYLYFCSCKASQYLYFCTSTRSKPAAQFTCCIGTEEKKLTHRTSVFVLLYQSRK